jgi:hypothetical protein
VNSAQAPTEPPLYRIFVPRMFAFVAIAPPDSSYL